MPHRSNGGERPTTRRRNGHAAAISSDLHVTMSDEAWQQDLEPKSLDPAPRIEHAEDEHDRIPEGRAHRSTPLTTWPAEDW